MDEHEVCLNNVNSTTEPTPQITFPTPKMYIEAGTRQVTGRLQIC